MNLIVSFAIEMVILVIIGIAINYGLKHRIIKRRVRYRK